MTRYFTADQHFGHENIIKFCDRPYNSVNHMNGVMLSNINQVCTEDDDLYVLGDWAMGRIADTLPLALELRPRLHLIPGNHDRCWTFGYKNATRREEWLQKYREVGFYILNEQVYINIGSYRVLLCHFPVTGDSHEGEDRFSERRPTRDGKWDFLLHGHTHDRHTESQDEINIGVDVWDFYPVHEDKLLQYMGD